MWMTCTCIVLQADWKRRTWGIQSKSFPCVPVSEEISSMPHTLTSRISLMMPIHSKCRERGKEREGGGKTLHGVNDVNNTPCLRGAGWVIVVCLRVLALQFLIVLPAFCQGPQESRDTVSCSLSLALVKGCVCLRVCEHTTVHACEILCVTVRLRELGCEKNKCMSVTGCVSWEFLGVWIGVRNSVLFAECILCVQQHVSDYSWMKAYEINQKYLKMLFI